MTIQQYTLEQTVAPAEEPVTVDKAKAYGWISGGDDDVLIAELIPAVREELEGWTGLQLVTATWKQYLDCWPCSSCCEIRPDKSPLLAVSSITYVDTAGDTQTWDSSLYQVDAVSRPGRIRPAYGQTWPSIRNQMNAITITFTAGFGNSAAVPFKLKQLLWQAAKYRFYHRDETNENWLAEFLTNHSYAVKWIR